MDRALRRILTSAVLLAAACGSPVVRAPAPVFGDEITLYRDRAVIRKRLEVTIPDADQTIVTLRVPAEVDVEDVVVLDRGDLTVTQALSPAEAVAPVWKRDPRTSSDDAGGGGGEDDETDETQPEAPAHQPPAPATGPKELRFVVTAARAGRYGLSLGYVTEQLDWDVAYTLTTTPARTQVSVRGAIVIRNGTGMTFPRARTLVVDSDLGSLRGRLSEQKDGVAPPVPREGSATGALPRELGVLALDAGETRVELLPGGSVRTARTVLVYDPIGTKHDHENTSPIRDRKLGTEKAPAEVKESLEIVRPSPSSEGLPGGPARLLERRADGSLVLIGESRLFDLATSIASVDIIDLGVADGVTGGRERRDFSIDDDRKRLVEEFMVSVANTRAYPVDIVLREHLYRSQNWALAYYTATYAKQDGAQQISLRLRVPAKGEAKLFYVVVYTWK